MCDSDGKKGRPGGLVLFAKRRSRSTASDRARAYAFEVFPPSSHTTPGRATAENRGPLTASRLDSVSDDTDEKQGAHPEMKKVGSNPAPAFEGSRGCLGAANNEGQEDGGGKKCLHLMHPSALETSAACYATVVAASFKIDLRGCSKRPTLLPLATTCGSGAGDLSPPLNQTAGLPPEAKGDRRHVGRRRRTRTRVTAGGLKHPKGPGRLDSAGTGSLSLHARQGTADTASDAVAAQMRSLRSAQHLTMVARGGGGSCLSEAQDTDELNSLLRMSRRIFSKAEAFEDVKYPPQQHLGWRKRAPQGHRPGVAFYEQPGKIGPPMDANSPGESGKILGRGAARESTSPPSVMVSSQPKQINAANTAPDVVEESRESSIEASKAIKEGANDQAQLDHIVTEVEERPSPEAVPPIESTRAPINGDGPWRARDGEGAASLARGYGPNFPSNEYTVFQPPEGSDAAQQLAKALPVVDSENLATVGDTANWNEPREASDAGEWVYDEATASWYPRVAADDGQANNDQGWRYDEQSATWYQEEAVPRESGPQDPSPNGAPHSASGTTEVVAEAENYCASGLEDMPIPNTETDSCNLQLNRGSQENVRERRHAELGNMG